MSSHYTRGGFGSRYRCPGCGLILKTGEPRKRYATFVAHVNCKVRCRECRDEIEQPPIGKAQLVQVYLGQPVHSRCKP